MPTNGVDLMLEIGLRDVNFAHVHSSSGWNTPKYFNWCRTPSKAKPCFFTDYCLDGALSTQASRKIAWLIEPPAICSSSYDYIQNHQNQFDYILTYNRALKGAKILWYPHGGCWVPGEGDQRNRQHNVKMHPKHQLVSIIASSKADTIGHRLRHIIISRYKQLSAFGPQYKTLEYKEDALIDYMFSIVIENSACDDYFTEKLIDCFAVGTVPIYWGTKSIGNYFNADGILTFDNTDELDNIMSNLSPELYNSRLRHIEDNFNRHFQYRVSENWIFEHYPYLFS
jgi:hypothetical protein